MSLTVADVLSHRIVFACLRRRRASPRLSYTSCVASSLVPRPVLSSRLVRHSRPARRHRRRFTAPPASPRFSSPASPCCPAGCPPTLHGGIDPSRRRRRRRSRAGGRRELAHRRGPPASTSAARAAAAAEPIVGTPAGADAAVPGTATAGATDRGRLGFPGDSKVPGANVRIVAPANCAHARRSRRSSRAVAPGMDRPHIFTRNGRRLAS